MYRGLTNGNNGSIRAYVKVSLVFDEEKSLKQWDQWTVPVDRRCPPPGTTIDHEICVVSPVWSPQPESRCPLVSKW